jgi:hypothetical protein
MSYRNETKRIDEEYAKAIASYREHMERDPEDWNELADAFGVKLCGCGAPEASIRLIVEIFSILEPPANFERDWDAIEAKLKTLGLDEDAFPGVFYLVFGALDDADLLEHGSNIRLSWPTCKGWAFVKGTELLPEEIER